MDSSPYIPHIFPDAGDQFTILKTRDGFGCRVLSSVRLVPELSDGDELSESLWPTSYGYIRDTYMEELLDKHTSQTVRSFEGHPTVASFLNVYTYYHYIDNGQDRLQGPWKPDDMRFKGIEYRNGPTIPLFDPRKIEVGRVTVEESQVLLHADLNGGACALCGPPRLGGTRSLELIRQLEACVKIDHLALAVPKLKGALTFSPDEVGYPKVVGYVLQAGICRLSEVPVWMSPPDHFGATLRKSYKRLCRLNVTWGGRGPENVSLDQDMQPFFDFVFIRWNCHNQLERRDDSRGMENVESFLKKPGPRRSLRIFKREKSKLVGGAADAEGDVPAGRLVRRVVDLPLDIWHLIFELVLLAPKGKLTWVFNQFMVEDEDNSPREWDGDGLIQVFPEARSFFYTRNRFVVDVNRLGGFLAQIQPNLPKTTQTAKSLDEEEYPFLRSITVRVSACRDDGCGFGWEEGIKKLSLRCPQLQEIRVSIYGWNDRYDDWWEDNSVLLELRKECSGFLREVSLADYQYLLDSVLETEAKILEWLQS